MNAVGKIGVIIPEIIDPLNYEFLDGVHTEAKRMGFDVIVFTGVFNSQVEFQYDSYIWAMENIYELVCKARLSAVLFCADMFYNQTTKQRVYDILALTNVPVYVLSEEHEVYPSLYMDSRQSFKILTRHLIEEHGYKKIYCISGIPGHHDSMERIAGYREALEENGIAFDEKNVFYGNFWIDEPRRIADEIASGAIEKPDAVACANDVMAVFFIEALRGHGIRVPEDIAVIGFDGKWDAYFTQPSVTTISGGMFCYGEEAVRRVLSDLNYDVNGYTEHKTRIHYGTSCGCSYKERAEERFGDIYLFNHVANMISRYQIQKQYIAANCISLMSNADTLEQFIIDADHKGHIIPGWKAMDLCLCTDWLMDFENTENYRRKGFTDKMILALSKRYGVNNFADYEFDTSSIVPCLNEPHEPQLWGVVSLHANDQIVGYGAFRYDCVNDICFDQTFVNWIDAFGNGLMHLQRELYRKHQQEQLARMSVIDPETGLYNKKGFMERVPEFMEQCRADEKKPLLMLLSSVCRSDDMERTGIDFSLIIANALRLSASKDELFARLESGVFAVALASEDEADANISAENRILALERKIQYIQGNISGMTMPEIVSDSCFVEDSMETAVERQLARITEKAAAAVNTYADYHEQLQQLRREIYLNPQLDWSIAAILKRVGISRSHFQRIYKKQFAVTCLDDVIQAKMEKAQQLLIYTDMRIQEIAEQCGYNNENHFMRQFKDKFGITAAKFRKDNR